jgi:1-deoxy-D-xylulose-5-phosphate reductoisomerase
VMNAANEIAVQLFLADKLDFLTITHLVEKVMASHELINNPDLEQILQADAWAREKVLSLSC